MSVITNAFPEGTHWMQGGRSWGTTEPKEHTDCWLEEVGLCSQSRVCSSSISKSLRGNCCGQPLFPVFGKFAAADVFEEPVRETAAALVVVRAPSTEGPKESEATSKTAESTDPDQVGLLAPLLWALLTVDATDWEEEVRTRDSTDSSVSEQTAEGSQEVGREGLESLRRTPEPSIIIPGVIMVAGLVAKPSKQPSDWGLPVGTTLVAARVKRPRDWETEMPGEKGVDMGNWVLDFC
jgi:hypothetical protein